ncbi:MAG: hypothetical protein ACPLZF_07320 [Nitrososphaeria archaeon]
MIPLISMILVLGIVLLFIVWAVASIPVYVSAKILTLGKSSLLQSMIATLFGSIVYVVTLAITHLIFHSFTISFLIAYFLYIWVFKSIFGVGWLKAIGISILAIIFTVIIQTILTDLWSLTFLPSPKWSI